MATVIFDPDVMKQTDELRGQISRTRWVNNALKEYNSRVAISRQKMIEMIENIRKNESEMMDEIQKNDARMMEDLHKLVQKNDADLLNDVNDDVDALLQNSSTVGSPESLAVSDLHTGVRHPKYNSLPFILLRF